ncbi:hypothetical protein [Bacillus sp. V5-8f]|uniref:hypothetical protein n=1 Tax=Bacillus sp. V5-8f TaxID=2053044 RepID=UPI000C76BD08|nr:hypothetical protein [Bacillus sp. V5-8f]PLT33273.1 hypothetical protein CUU64_14620 [Bacillus sp. V5-8f]
MCPFDGDSAKVYKKMEEDLNRKIRCMTNSMTFVKMAGEAMDTHLNHVVAIRNQSQKWLDRNNLASRNDMADMAKRIIRHEDRLDLLDDELYDILTEVKSHRIQLRRLTDELSEIAEELECKEKHLRKKRNYTRSGGEKHGRKGKKRSK